MKDDRLAQIMATNPHSIPVISRGCHSLSGTRPSVTDVVRDLILGDALHGPFRTQLRGRGVVPRLVLGHVKRTLQLCHLIEQLTPAPVEQVATQSQGLIPHPIPVHELADVPDLHSRTLEAVDHPQRAEILLAEQARPTSTTVKVRQQALPVVVTQRRGRHSETPCHFADGVRHGVFSHFHIEP